MSAGLRIGTVCISLLPPLLLLQLQILGMSLPFAGWSWVLTSSVCGRKAVSMCSVSATGLLATFLPTPIPQPQLSLVLALRTALMGQLTPLSCTVFRAHPDICPQPPTHTLFHQHTAVPLRLVPRGSWPLTPHSGGRASPHVPGSVVVGPDSWWDHATRRWSSGSEHGSRPGTATPL